LLRESEVNSTEWSQAYIQEEREVGVSIEEREVGRFVSEIAKPYHMHKSTQSTGHTLLTTGFTIRTQNAQIKGWSVTIVHN